VLSPFFSYQTQNTTATEKKINSVPTETRTAGYTVEKMLAAS